MVIKFDLDLSLFASLYVYFQLFRLCNFLIESQPIQLKISPIPVFSLKQQLLNLAPKAAPTWKAEAQLILWTWADYADEASDLRQESKHISVSWTRNVFIWTSTKPLSCVIAIVSWWQCSSRPLLGGKMFLLPTQKRQIAKQILF